ncbi:hypothetical protein [Limimaricola pyoseonensis]|uniref:Transferrin-binding protein B C-lobe/N-lobe beta barrel domain-containing protein n=1 Tax=Limimaricola pyoseonensis TaxID=521013 RepID=A0A1G7IGJ4_9RHOB|nr:hypothetical protein [Limimaricola pyoseonensis]SDF11870.1 hypothetical protein SAMN04488567_3461 [Limimaricola pyoseonensis]
MRQNYSIALIALTALAACGGSSGQPNTLPDTPGAPDVPNNTSIPGMSDPHYETTVGMSYNQSTEVSSLAVISDRDGPEQRTGSIALVPAGSRDHGYMYDVDVAELAVDPKDDSFIDRAEAYLHAAIGEEFVAEGITIVGEAILGDGKRMLIAEHEFMGRRFYIPADGSPMRMGAFSTSYDDDDMVAHAVFGIETEMADVARQTGTASFSGLSEASVLGGSVESNYRGTSQGTIDFETGSFSVSASLRSDADNEISVTSNGMMSDGGEMEGLMIANGLLADGGRVDGAFEGQLFGSNADDIGGTFSGGTGSTNIAGQMIMSR